MNKRHGHTIERIDDLCANFKIIETPKLGKNWRLLFPTYQGYGILPLYTQPRINQLRSSHDGIGASTVELKWNIMDEKNRNFRAGYYQKVGFRSIEEKKSLEILLSENPIEKKRLTHFTLRFTVPNSCRNVLYKILFGILPVCQPVWTFVKQQRKEQFEDLMHGLRILRIEYPQYTKAQVLTLLRALEKGNLRLNIQQQLEFHDNLMFARVCETLDRHSESDSDLYWISKGFFELFLSFRPYLKALCAYTDKLMLKEDAELYQYLVDRDIWENVPLETWYENALVAVLPGIALQRVWDKLLGGSSIYMIFVIFCLFFQIKNTILQHTCVQKVIECTKQLTESCYEVIVTESITLWQNYGSPLHPGSITDCFKDHSKFAIHKSSSNNG